MKLNEWNTLNDIQTNDIWIWKLNEVWLYWMQLNILHIECNPAMKPDVIVAVLYLPFQMPQHDPVDLQFTCSYS